MLPAPLIALILHHLRFDAADGTWPDRDRLVADPVMAEAAAAAMALTGAAPGCVIAPGGPPGLAFGVALGLALAERLLATRFGRSLVDHRIWLLAGETELFAGGAMEAAAVAGAQDASRLTVLAELPAMMMPAAERYAALGWTVRRVLAAEDIAGALSAALRARKPSLLLCAPGLAVADEPASVAPEQPDAHGTPDPDFAQRTRAAYDESHARLARDEHLAARLARAGVRGAGARRGWLKRLQRHTSADAFRAAQAGQLPQAWVTHLREPVEAAPDQPVSTAALLRGAIARLAAALPELAGLAPEDAPGLPVQRALPWGTQTLAQMAGLLGMAQHGGVLPLGVLPWAAHELAGPALRAAAAARRRLVAAIAVPHGQDAGNALAAWRAMAGLAVFRPADATEALMCAALALRQPDRPSLLLLSEILCPRLPAGTKVECARGAYMVREPALRDLTLIASGPELHAALILCDQLAAAGLAAAVVSMPCWSAFAAADEATQEAILGSAPRVGLEAGSGFGWERWLGPQGLFIALDRPDPDPAALARVLTQLLRRHQRSPAILETSDNVLESGAGFN